MMGMAAFFLIFSLIAIIAAMLALVRPGWALPWMHDPTRLQAAGLWVGIMLVSSFAGLLYLPPSSTKELAAFSPPAIDSAAALPAADFTTTRYREACGQDLSEETFNQYCAGKSFAGDVYIVRVNGRRSIDVRPDFTIADSPMPMTLVFESDVLWDAPPTTYVDTKIRVTGTIGQAIPFDRLYILEHAAIIGHPSLTAEEAAVKARRAAAAAARGTEDRGYQIISTKVYPACVAALNEGVNSSGAVNCPWFTGVRYFPRDNGWIIISSCDTNDDEGKWIPYAFQCEYQNGAVTKLKLDIGE